MVLNRRSRFLIRIIEVFMVGRESKVFINYFNMIFKCLFTFQIYIYIYIFLKQSNADKDQVFMEGKIRNTEESMKIVRHQGNH